MIKDNRIILKSATVAWQIANDSIREIYIPLINRFKSSNQPHHHNDARGLELCLTNIDEALYCFNREVEELHKQNSSINQAYMDLVGIIPEIAQTAEAKALFGKRLIESHKRLVERMGDRE